MELSDVRIGACYTYYPKDGAANNLHYPAVVVAVNKETVTVLLFMEGAPSAFDHRLVDLR